MPNIGLPEIIIVLVIALLVFGPKKLPEMGRSLGKSLREFKNATSGIKDELQLGLNDEPAKPDAAAAAPVVAAAAAAATVAPVPEPVTAAPVAADEAAANDFPPPPEYDPQAEAEALAAYGIDSHGDPVAQAAPAEPEAAEGDAAAPDAAATPVYFDALGNEYQLAADDAAAATDQGGEPAGAPDESAAV
jgi:sec-independent protein translocase protein TatA